MLIPCKSNRTTLKKIGAIMGKHLDKMQRALAQRQAATYASGEKKPGSMNVKKTGYRGQKAQGSK